MHCDNSPTCTGAQDDAAKQQLFDQLLTKQEQMECFMRDRKHSLATAVEHAKLWVPPQPTSDSHSEQQQHDWQTQLGQQQMAAQYTQHSSNAVTDIPEGAGYVSVCGIVLPSKPSPTASQAATAGPQLVQTTAVAEILQAAALALSQHRPILLEGPPG